MHRAHILPLLLDLLETRDSHVRLVLLEHIESFAYLCSSEDIKEFLLPEVCSIVVKIFALSRSVQVLVGLKATQDDIVAATLRTLSVLVPLVGSATVMGTSKSKKAIFTDARPKVRRTFYSLTKCVNTILIFLRHQEALPQLVGVHRFLVPLNIQVQTRKDQHAAKPKIDWRG